MAKKEAFLQFLKAARSLQDRGLSKEAIVQFAKNEFGELSELFKKQIDSLFKPKKGIENIKIKDPDFDDTVVKMQFDDAGVPFNPKDPLKTKSLTYEEAIAKEKARAAADEDYIMKIFDPEDFAKGGRAGYYTGGITDVEPSLDDIGHGSDSLMSRTRLMSPGSQATTSTGLNYLLAEDNDNIRVPFAGGGSDRMMSNAEKEERAYNLMRDAMDKEKFLKRRREEMEMDKKRLEEKRYGIAVAEGGRIGFAKGKIAKEVLDKGRRGFMKAAGAAGAGIAALKTGLLGFGEKAAPVAKEVIETVSETAQGVPPYFLKLVEKIKDFGTDVTKTIAYKDKQKVTKYKDYELTEDLTTGEQTIQRMKVLDEGEADYYGTPLVEETYMSYRPGKGQMDETMKGKTPPDDYEEGTAYLRTDKQFSGDVVDEMSGISDDIFKEVGEEVPEAIRKTKADGGRIGFGKGDIVTKGIPALIKAGEGKFTKAQYLIERIKNAIKGNPDDKYVQETFPNFIKELEANPDLAKNENVFKELGGDLPEGQKIVVYGDDTLDFFTESSGPQNIKKIDRFMEKHGLSRDKALEIMKMEPDDQVMELTKRKFLKQKRTDNAQGGLQTMLGE